MIALAGSHRTGKSTLARAWAEKFGWAYIPSRAGEVFKSFGFAVGQPLTFAQRMDVQEKILEVAVTDYKGGRDHWIADRSPLDMATYVLAELVHLPDSQPERIKAYVGRCFEETNRRCPVVVLVQPGIPYVAEEGKPPANDMAQEQFNYLLWGIMQDRRLKARFGFIGRDVTDLEDRIAMLAALHQRFVQSTIQQMMEEGGPAH